MNGPADENPYEPPQAEPARQLPLRSREELRYLFKQQQWIALAFLVQFLSPALHSLVSVPDPLNKLPLLFAVAVAVLVGLLFCCVVVYRLAQPIMGSVSAAICAVLMIVPYVALIVLVFVNRSAKAELRRHGIEVGLFGSNYEDI